MKKKKKQKNETKRKRKNKKKKKMERRGQSSYVSLNTLKTVIAIGATFFMRHAEGKRLEEASSKMAKDFEGRSLFP